MTPAPMLGGEIETRLSSSWNKFRFGLSWHFNSHCKSQLKLSPSCKVVVCSAAAGNARHAMATQYNWTPGA